jgi:CheY-like chemotaxis protein
MSTNVHIKQVLVVEDNRGDVQLIREVFGDEHDVQWHFVDNLVRAHHFLTHRPPYEDAPKPDLILLDLKLPIFPGFTLIPQIRNDPALKDIKIVVFTSSGAERDRALCAQYGADAYVVKPLSLRDWSSTLRQVLNG